MFSLEKKNILVTGASSGIGKQIALHVAQQGSAVTLIGRDLDRLKETQKKLHGNDHQCFSLDLTNHSEVVKFIAQQKPFDGIVLNAGVIDYVPVKFITEEKINAIFDVNFKSTVILSQQLVKNKLISKSGSIVFISSISAKLGVPGTAIYASSKAALSAYSKVIASELSIQKIRSNCICPGIIITSMTETAINVSSESIAEAEKAYPLGYGKPEDVANLVVFLLSDESRWMTGTDLVLDGGLTLK